MASIPRLSTVLSPRRPWPRGGGGEGALTRYTGFVMMRTSKKYHPMLTQIPGGNGHLVISPHHPSSEGAGITLEGSGYVPVPHSAFSSILCCRYNAQTLFSCCIELDH